MDIFANGRRQREITTMDLFLLPCSSNFKEVDI